MKEIIEHVNYYSLFALEHTLIVCNLFSLLRQHQTIQKYPVYSDPVAVVSTKADQLCQLYKKKKYQ